MPPVLDLRERVGALAKSLYALLDADDKVWREDLSASLAIREFNPAQIEAMKEAATPTCCDTFNVKSNFAAPDFPDHIAKVLTHAFHDPLMKAACSFDWYAEGRLSHDDPSYTLTMIVQTRSMLRELAHNYPLLLGEDMPGSVQQILDGIGADILPALDGLAEEIETGNGLDVRHIPPGRGWEHLHTLPPEVF